MALVGNVPAACSYGPAWIPGTCIRKQRARHMSLHHWGSRDSGMPEETSCPYTISKYVNLRLSENPVSKTNWKGDGSAEKNVLVP